MKVTSAIALIALAGNSSAFAPPGTPTFVRKEAISIKNTPTSLSMNMFDRFSRVAKANINNVLKTMEDPEKILNQAMEDMQVSLFQFDARIMMGQCMMCTKKQHIFLKIKLYA